jgi:putative flippase GtrA
MIFDKQIARYIFIAILAYVIDFGGFWMLYHAGLPAAASNVSVKIGAAIFGFYAHRYFTYQINGRSDIFSHAAKYFGVALLYTPASTLVLLMLIRVLSPVMLAKFCSDVILFLCTYFVTSKFVFLKQK